MAAVRILRGDLIAAGRAGHVDYLLHQCNCLTVRPHGLSQTLAAAWPAYANAYGARTPIDTGRNCATADTRAVLGTYAVARPPSADVAGPAVVALFAQWYPGKIGVRYARTAYPPPPDGLPETASRRLAWFKQALAALADGELRAGTTRPDARVGVPMRIGCGLAGGNWRLYRAALDEFAAKLRPTDTVFLYDLE